MPEKAKSKILIAEDEAALARALQVKLAHEGFEVVVAHDGDDAVEKLGTEKPDLIILDLLMPKRDGFGVLTYLKEKKLKIPVIIASNLNAAEEIDRAKSLGAVDYFVKADTPIADIVKKAKTYL